MDAEKLDLELHIGKADRDLIVTAMQALYRQRMTAKKVVLEACRMSGTVAPDDSAFGVDEAFNMLKRIGASPSHF